MMELVKFTHEPDNIKYGIRGTFEGVSDYKFFNFQNKWWEEKSVNSETENRELAQYYLNEEKKKKAMQDDAGEPV